MVVSGERSILEYIDHIDDSVARPSQVKDGYFVTSYEPGYGVKYTEKAVANYSFPGGIFWRSPMAKPILEAQK